MLGSLKGGRSAWASRLFGDYLAATSFVLAYTSFVGLDSMNCTTSFHLRLSLSYCVVCALIEAVVFGYALGGCWARAETLGTKSGKALELRRCVVAWNAVGKVGC